jgi:DNA-binding NarL/FixJ family response regulator
MFYRQLAEVSTYVTDHKYQLNDLLRLLCLRALSDLKVEALVFNELDALGTTTVKHFFGFEASDKDGVRPSYKITEKTPFTDSIRDHRTIWIDSLPTWPKEYSNMKSIAVPKQFKTLIVSPVESRGLPIGSLSIYSSAKLAFDEAIVQFIEAISMILASSANIGGNSTSIHAHEIRTLSNNGPGSEETELGLQDYREPLSERQELILKMISEGRTNAAIADVLGYSESLIRQETIRIYAKLGCSGRNEAAQIYIRSRVVETAGAIKNSA